MVVGVNQRFPRLQSMWEFSRLASNETLDITKPGSLSGRRNKFPYDIRDCLCSNTKPFFALYEFSGKLARLVFNWNGLFVFMWEGFWLLFS